MKFADKTLYDFQIEAYKQTLEHFKKNRYCRVLIKSPTGTGKTLVIGNIIFQSEIHKVLMEGKDRKTFRVVFKSHMKRLNSQARKLFLKQKGIKHIESQEVWLDPNYVSNAKVEIVFQQLGEKLDPVLDIDLVVYDETHHEACNTAQEFLEIAGKFPFIGVTATPDRADSMLIKFDKIVETITRQEAVERGFICQTTLKSIVDTHGTNKFDLFKDVFDHFGHQMGQTFMFFRTLKEVQQAADYIASKGYKVAGVTTQTDAELEFILDEFAEGNIQFVVNAKKLGEGIDVIGVTDCYISKQVGSYTDLNQYIGRAARPDDERCTVWEMINPLSGSNLDTTVVVGRPKEHSLIYKQDNEWYEMDFLHH